MSLRHTARDRAPHTDLASLYDEHVWSVYGFFGYHRLPRHDIEDLTQATFERAIRAWPRYDPAKASVKTWLIAIAQNLLIDHHRRERPRRHYSIDEHGFDEAQLGHADGPDTPGPDTPFELSHALRTALATLSQRERHVIALRFGGALSGPEIAALLDLSLANVQQLASRALRKLRAQLDDDAAYPSHTVPADHSRTVPAETGRTVPTDSSRTVSADAGPTVPAAGRGAGAAQRLDAAEEMGAAAP